VLGGIILHVVGQIFARPESVGKSPFRALLAIDHMLKSGKGRGELEAVNRNMRLVRSTHRRFVTHGYRCITSENIAEKTLEIAKVTAARDVLYRANEWKRPQGQK
jgi:hypothetical protein